LKENTIRYVQRVNMYKLHDINLEHNTWTKVSN